MVYRFENMIKELDNSFKQCFIIYSMHAYFLWKIRLKNVRNIKINFKIDFKMFNTLSIKITFQLITLVSASHRILYQSFVQFLAQPGFKLKHIRCKWDFEWAKISSLDAGLSGVAKQRLGPAAGPCSMARFTRRAENSPENHKKDIEKFLWVEKTEKRRQPNRSREESSS